MGLSTGVLKFLPGNDRPALQRLYLLAGAFFAVVLAFSLNRYYTLYSSYDHGLFNQLFWNNLHGNWFQSSLTSGNSVGVLEDGKTPTVAFYHLGQHFVPSFLLWLPFYALFPHPVTLVILQVGLMTAGGLVLYALARHRLPAQHALWITAGYYCANAVLGPTFANFYEQCQIPLLLFSLLLAMEKQWWRLFWLLVVLSLGIREDTGIALFGIGVYLLGSRRHLKTGFSLCLVSFVYVVVVTTLVMPHFSDDSGRLYLATRFRQFVDTDSPSSLDVLWGIITHPIAFLSSLLWPPGQRIVYLLRHWLPLALVPALSPATWTLTIFPLLSLLIQEGKSALSITLRYSIAVVPGLFYGTILWWAAHPGRLAKPQFRRFWRACLALSLVLALLSNPNRAFSFLIPDSFRPWVHTSLPRLWEHAAQARQVMQAIPPDARVATTTYLIPHLSSRRALLRLPAIQIQNDQGQVVLMDYLLADLWQMKVYQVAFREDYNWLYKTFSVLDAAIEQDRYGVMALQDGVVLLAKDQASNPEALQTWGQWRQELLQLFLTSRYR